MSAVENIQSRTTDCAVLYQYESMLRPTRLLRAAEWSKTLQLPKSSFPPRPSLSERPKYLQQCTDDLYAWQATHRPASEPFVFHDGPPYANGSLHIGHGLNKVLKDIICRFQLSQGRRIHYVPGWDCHGLPIEVKALQALGEGAGGDHRKMKPVDIRKAATKLAEKTIKEQRKAFREWAVMGDWDNAYKTMEKSFEVRQLRIFKGMVEKGLVYRQHKPVYWSPSSGTALAEAELEYDEKHESLAAYVGFRLTRVPEVLNEISKACHGALYALIWTTTPWTLPANSAIAVHNNLEYSVVRHGYDGPCFVIATDRIEDVVKVSGMDNIEMLVSGIRGLDLAGKTGYVPSVINETDEEQIIIHADFVSAGSGTGIVHCAAGHGFDDYNVCTPLGIKAIAPVDEAGRFTDTIAQGLPSVLNGQDVLKGGSEAVIQYLMTLDAGGRPLDWQVVGLHKYQHKYPIDWRTKEPLIIRATAQWFADVGLIKEAAMEALASVKFVPESGRSRLESFIKGRSQWCISRQRAWGVPIPALYRHFEGRPEEAVMTPETIEHIIGVIEARGINSWWTDAPDDPAWVHPSLPAGIYTRGADTMDVWFDSGTTWTLLPDAFSGSSPADVVLEGTDQHRGWFQSSLLTFIASQTSSTIAATPRAPYKTLLTHGFTLDQDGRKMSKSLGNVISPSQIMDGSLLPPLKLKQKQQVHVQAKGAPAYDAMGPDALRFWAAGSDYTRDVVVGESGLKAVNATLHKIRVTLKWLLGVLSDVSRSTFQSSPLHSSLHATSTSLSELIALQHLHRAASAIHAAYASLEPFKAVQLLTRYINHDLSAQWFEAAKDPLYAGTEAERRAAQKVCYEVLQQLLAVLAPVTPLLVQETLAHMPGELRQLFLENDHDPFKRIWTPFADPTLGSGDTIASGLELLVQTNALETIHAQIRTLQEAARVDKLIGSGLECRVILTIGRTDEHDPTGTTTQGIPIRSHQSVYQMLHDAQAKDEGLEKFFVVSDVEIMLEEHQLQEVAAELNSVTKSADWHFSSTVFMLGTRVHVKVAKAKHGKCPRCWQYKVVQLAQVEQSDKLCQRCEEVINAL